MKLKQFFSLKPFTAMRYIAIILAELHLFTSFGYAKDVRFMIAEFAIVLILNYVVLRLLWLRYDIKYKGKQVYAGDFYFWMMAAVYAFGRGAADPKDIISSTPALLLFIYIIFYLIVTTIFTEDTKTEESV